MRWLPHSVLQIGEKYVIVFSCSCYFFSTNLFNQLLCSTNQPTILFMPSPTVSTIQSMFPPTPLFHHFLQPIPPTFRFFPTMCLTNLPTTSANLFFSTFLFQPLFTTIFFYPFSLLATNQLCQSFYSTILCALLLNNLHSQPPFQLSITCRFFAFLSPPPWFFWIRCAVCR